MRANSGIGLIVLGVLLLFPVADCRAARPPADEIVRVMRSIDGESSEVRVERRGASLRFLRKRNRVVAEEKSATRAELIAFRQKVAAFRRETAGASAVPSKGARFSCRARYRIIYRAGGEKFNLRGCFELGGDRFNALFFDVTRLVLRAASPQQ
mgnify:CR=1 FL=1